VVACLVKAAARAVCVCVFDATVVAGTYRYTVTIDNTRNFSLQISSGGPGGVDQKPLF
jgi:hypothetical protein